MMPTVILWESRLPAFRSADRRHLIADPEQAKEPRTAAKLLAVFLKRAELRIKTALAEGDFRDVPPCGERRNLSTRSYQTGERLLGSQVRVGEVMRIASGCDARHHRHGRD
jgi:hypothetical protein